MLISHNKKFIFIKTLKTAGTSVESILEKWCLPPKLYNKPVHGRKFKKSKFGVVAGRLQAQNRAHMSLIKAKQFLTENQYKEYTKITIVRQPLDQLISFFYFRNHNITKNLSDEEQIKMFKDFFSEEVEKKYFNWNILLNDGKPGCDFYIRFEFLLKDLEILNDKLDLELDLSILPKFKGALRNKNINIDEFYNKDMIEKLKNNTDIMKYMLAFNYQIDI